MIDAKQYVDDGVMVRVRLSMLMVTCDDVSMGRMLDAVPCVVQIYNPLVAAVAVLSFPTVII